MLFAVALGGCHSKTHVCPIPFDKFRANQVIKIIGAKPNPEISEKICLGKAYFYLGDHVKSAELYEGVLKNELNDNDKAWALFGQAIALKYLEQPNRAINLLNQSLYFAAKSNDRELRSATYATLGSIYGDMKGDENAKISIDQSKKALIYLSSTNDKSATLNNISLAYLSLGDFTQAREYIDQAIALDIKTKNERYLGIHGISKAKILEKSGNPLEVLKIVVESTEKLQRTGDQFWELQGEIIKITLIKKYFASTYENQMSDRAEFLCKKITACSLDQLKTKL